MDTPKPVGYAVRLMYIAVICYFLANARGIALVKIRSDLQFLLFLMTIALCAIYCLLVSRISQRSKFALILLSVLGLVSAVNLASLAVNVRDLTEAFNSAPFVAALGLAAAGLHVVAVVLLFLPASRDWFWRAQAG